MISRFATSEGTKNFLKNSGITSLNFKQIHNLTLSNVGVGTYLGEANEQTDELVKKAERSVGKAISELINEGKISRDQIFISTKNGYITNDADVKQDFWEYIKNEYTQKGVIKEGDVTSGYHCMTVAYLDDQLER